MQRFFCNICNKIKRVQHLPSNVENALATMPKERVGQCNRHTSGRELARLEHRIPVNVSVNKSRKVS